jgi:uncharacterized membrane protein
MFESVDSYLESLAKELAGSDPATVQDALSDAEEHLRTAFASVRAEKPDQSDTEILARIVDDYGSPADIAAAYREIEDRTPPTLAPPPRPADPLPGGVSRRSATASFFGVLVDPRAYAALFYMLFSLITGIVYFTWAVTGLSLSLGFLVMIFGIPFIILFLLSLQGIALVEGRIVEGLLGVRMPRRPLFSGRHLGFWDRLKVLFTDKLSWTIIAYMLIQLPLGVLYFTVFITFIVLGIAGILQPVIQYGFGFPYAHFDGYDLYIPWWLSPLWVFVGVLWIVVTMHLAKVVGRMHGTLAKSLLVRD